MTWDFIVLLKRKFTQIIDCILFRIKATGIIVILAGIFSVILIVTIPIRIFRILIENIDVEVKK